MEIDELIKESLLGRIHKVQKHLSIIDIEYEPCISQEKKKFTCYLHSTDYQKNIEKAQTTSSVNSNLYSYSEKPIRTKANCLKKLNKLKKDLLTLQLNFQKNDEKSNLESQKMLKLDKKTMESRKKIKNIKNTVKIHQEKLIRMEGLMHELEYSYSDKINSKNAVRPSLNYKKKLKKINLNGFKKAPY